MTKRTHNTLVVLDVHAILHRAYHALPDFTSPKGEPTGALYGLVAMLLKIVADLKPDYLVAGYDLPKPTYRHEAYEGYKAKRVKTEDELVAQIERSRDIFEAFGIPVYQAEGFEADDIIGTVVEKTKTRANVRVVIASGDMDTLQLVDGEKVRVYTLKKGIKETIIYDEVGVKERFGFPPELLPDYKGLRGDPSDNIPGVPGIGEKTAGELIQKFGSLENIYTALGKSKEKFLKEGVKPRIAELLEEHKEEAEFSKLLATIRRDAPIDFSLPKEWNGSHGVPKILALFNELGFRTLSERVKTLFKDERGGEQQVTDADNKEETEEVSERDLKETAVALWLLNSDITSPSLEDVLQYGKTRHFAEAREIISRDLKRHKLEGVFEDIEKPLIPVVEKMIARGVKIDTAHLKKLGDAYRKELQKIEQNIWKAAGGEFNINSPRQLAEVLFDHLKLGTGRKKLTATGQRSTREEELQKLVGAHPVVAEILAYRELQKLLSTYIDPLPALLGADGRLHATFLQAGTTTGRMASQAPNLQNIPIKSELGRPIRSAFVADEGFLLAACDYSQIELRIAAILSGDAKMLETFRNGIDIHTRVAAEVFDVPLQKVTPDMRRRAKVVNFGILYGMGSNALSKVGEISREDAQKFLTKYFEEFPGLAKYIAETKQKVARQGFAETLFGRRRYLPGIASKLPHIRAEAERMAINAPMQGTQADIIKIAMTRVDTFLREKDLTSDVFLLLQIHDELVYEIREPLVPRVVPEIKRIMESVLPEKDQKKVPIIADVSVGKSWGDMKKFGT